MLSAPLRASVHFVYLDYLYTMTNDHASENETKIARKKKTAQ